MGQNWRGGASKSDELPTGPTVPGAEFVYVLAKSPQGPTKIGISKTVRKRVKSLETAIGERFTLHWVSEECMNSAEVEAALLVEFSKYRTIGEWVALPFSEVVAVAQKAKYVLPDYDANMEQLREAANRVRPINMPGYPRS